MRFGTILAALAVANLSPAWASRMRHGTVGRIPSDDPDRARKAREFGEKVAHFATNSRQQKRAKVFAKEMQRVNANWGRGDASLHGFTMPRKARRKIARAWAKQYGMTEAA